MALTDDQILTKVKAALGITGNYQDETLKVYVAEAKSFMLRAGVTKSKAESEEAGGLYALLVSDLWNYGSGSVKLSEYAVQRVIQLAETPDEGEGGQANA